MIQVYLPSGWNTAGKRLFKINGTVCEMDDIQRVQFSHVLREVEGEKVPADVIMPLLPHLDNVTALRPKLSTIRPHKETGHYLIRMTNGTEFVVQAFEVKALLADKEAQ